MNYYNEWDKPTAAWLRELIAQGLVPQGEVDERSITKVQPADLRGYTQCHFFAGIGGWSYALRLAGWSPDRPVWTGSCPCQPYSVAGKREGHKDERHLWPEMYRLIRECKPQHVFGEQVTGAIGHGWLDGVSADLEAEGYAVGAVVLGAHSVGAPHIRQRLYWMGHRVKQGLEGCGQSGEIKVSQGWQGEERHDTTTGRAGGLPDTECSRHQPQQDARPSSVQPAVACEEKSWVAVSEHGSGFHWIPDTDQRAVIRGGECESGTTWGQVAQQSHGSNSANHADNRDEVGAFWAEYDILPFLDGKARRIEPGTFPLAHGIPARVVRLRGYGNAIVPQVAAEFVRAYMEVAA